MKIIRLKEEILLGFSATFHADYFWTQFALIVRKCAIEEDEDEDDSVGRKEGVRFCCSFCWLPLKNLS